VYYVHVMTNEEPPPDRAPRKDRLVQARVPKDLEQTLKAEARRRRLSLSQLVRNVLEDAFELVDGVVSDVDQIVSDSFTLARNVSRGAQRLADPERRLAGESPDGEAPAARDELDEEGGDPGTITDEGQPVAPSTDLDLSHVYGWNELVLHRAARCAQCGMAIDRGQRGFASLSDRPDAERAWLCPRCVESL
jgi:hypothetical protein